MSKVNNKTLSNKTLSNKTIKFNLKKINDDDMEFLDSCIKENKHMEEINKINNLNQKTLLDDLLNDINTDTNNNKNKVRKAINLKQQTRGMPTKKEIQSQELLLKEMMAHPKMTQEILVLYGKAIAYNSTKNVPNPLEIFDNDEKFRIEYYQYIIKITELLKEQNKDTKNLKQILSNPYAQYMSTCLRCQLNPFENNDLNENKKNNNDLNELSNAKFSLTTKLPNELTNIKKYDEISDNETDDDSVSDMN